MLLPVLANAACEPGVLRLKSGDNLAKLSIELVDTFETRAQGLMFRESMPKYSGMLFVYEQPQSVSFWMRNTLIPLDMIFVDEFGVVQKIHENAIPLDETSIFGGDSIFAVLEVNAGMAEKLRFKPGTVLQHARFDQETSAWPCKN